MKIKISKAKLTVVRSVTVVVPAAGPAAPVSGVVVHAVAPDVDDVALPGLDGCFIKHFL